MARRTGCTCDGSPTLCPRCAGILFKHEQAISQSVDRLAAGLAPGPGEMRAGDGRGTAPQESERTFQERVIALAKAQGWLCYFTHDSRRSPAGFPDLVCCDGHSVVYAELKKAGEKPSKEQTTWLSHLRHAGQEVYLWYPADWAAIVARLTRAILP